MADVTVQAYCVKERKKVDMQEPQEVTMKNGRKAVKGKCPSCGNSLFKIGGMPSS